MRTYTGPVFTARHFSLDPLFLFFSNCRSLEIKGDDANYCFLAPTAPTISLNYIYLYFILHYIYIAFISLFSFFHLYFLFSSLQEICDRIIYNNRDKKARQKSSLSRYDKIISNNFINMKYDLYPIAHNFYHLIFLREPR